MAQSSSSDKPKQPEIAPLFDEVCEQAVIGCLLIDRDTIAAVARILSADDFWRPFHRFVYQLMLDMWAKREPCDLVTFASEFWRRIHALPQADVDALNMPDVPESYVAECTQIAYTAVHAEWYARRVLDFADRARLARAVQTGMDGAYKTDSDMDVVVEETATAARDARRTKPAGRYTALGDVDDDASFPPLPRLEIGGTFQQLDSITGGFEPGQLVVVAARPSVGKSAIVLQWLYLYARMHNRPVGLISLEMARRDVRNRLMAMASRVDMHAIRTGAKPSEDDKARIKLASELFSTLPILLDDDPDTSLTGVLARAKAMASEQRIVMLGVDYLQLMHVPGKTDGRTQEVSKISAALKQLARELGIPVIALAQLNRGVEMRPDAEPRISDLRDSGAVEQDADIVILIHRVNDDGKVKLIVGKNRNGPVGFVEMQFHKPTASFVTLPEAA